MNKTQKKRAQRALARAKDVAGCSADLARALGITPQSVSEWDVVPVARVIPIEKSTGVLRYDLRPDIYPEPPEVKECD